jgi:hypothetical protein
MTRGLKNLLKEGKHNEEFISQMKKADEGFTIPNFLTSEIDKMLYISMYIGWLVARNEYNELNYL